MIRATAAVMQALFKNGDVQPAFLAFIYRFYALDVKPLFGRDTQEVSFCCVDTFRKKTKSTSSHESIHTKGK